MPDPVGPPTLAQIADELYGLTPDAFIAARNDRAREARSTGGRELADQVRALSKPSAAAWATNMLARHRAAVLEQVVDLGETMRAAQEDLDPVALRELGRQRRRLVSAVAQQAGALADQLGHAVSAPALLDVEHTLQAAMSDPDAAIAVLSGRLLRALTAEGLDSVDLSGAVAAPEGGPAPRARPVRAVDGVSERERRRDRERTEADRALKDAEARLEAASAVVLGAARRADDAADRRDGLEGELDQVRARIGELERDIGTAERELRAIERDRAKAEREADASRREAERARERLERLR